MSNHSDLSNKFNTEISNNNPSKDYLEILGSNFKKQYGRLDFVNILTVHNKRLCFNNVYEELTSCLKKDEPKTIKSLNTI